MALLPPPTRTNIVGILLLFTSWMVFVLTADRSLAWWGYAVRHAEYRDDTIVVDRVFRGRDAGEWFAEGRIGRGRDVERLPLHLAEGFDRDTVAGDFPLGSSIAVRFASTIPQDGLGPWHRRVLPSRPFDVPNPWAAVATRTAWTLAPAALGAGVLLGGPLVRTRRTRRYATIAATATITLDHDRVRVSRTSLGQRPRFQTRFLEPHLPDGTFTGGGLEVVLEDGSIACVTVHVRDFAGRLERDGEMVVLGADATLDDVCAIFGEPYGTTTDDVETTAWYECDRHELQFDFDRRGRLTTIFATREPELADADRRAELGIDRPWPPPRR